MATRKAIEHRVHTIIDTMGTACPFKLANKMHIPIVYTTLPKQIRGYMLHMDKRCCIVVSDSINDWEAPMVVAHEMGHYFMHDNQFYLFHYNCGEYRCARREYEADLFAFYLLSHKFIQVKRMYDKIPPFEKIVTCRDIYNLFVEGLVEW